ncbi:MAG: thioredoxin domain-containing protein, partial [Nocardiopsaceae bacterium]|nr:thioredoxin domain-containing protein [Nocardiopsaceae bacterium]
RPDIDAVYMTATQAMTGQGGWPMTVFMTPAGDPFYCGTYFPKPQFMRLVEAVGRAWRSDRGQVVDQAERISAALSSNASSLAGLAAPSGDLSWESVTDAAVAALEDTFDSRDGGFGGAPKFPPSMVLEFLVRQGSPRALRMVTKTGEAMARGGIYDQLGGGFARYSVDGTWTVPHFEKMLYDNALLARAYLHWWRAAPPRGDDPPGAPSLARRVAEETCEFVARELRTAEGGFAASLDADSAGYPGSGGGTGSRGDTGSPGGEGAYYVWTPAQLRDVLGEADGEWAASVFGVTAAGTFEHGASVLRRRSDPDDLERLDRIRGTLLAAREGRPRPARDDKVVAAWNGMAIAALAEAGLLLDRADFLAAASDAASLLVSLHLSDGRLVRTSRDGTASGSAGLLEDYACVASGLLALAGVSGNDRWVSVAGELLETVLTSFGDGSGGFYDAPADGERLIFRPADPTDNATPSGTFAAADALLSYAALTGSSRHRDAAVSALKALPTLASRYPRAAGMGLAVAQALLSGPAEVAIVGPPDDPRTSDLLRTALHAASPGAVFALGTGDGDDTGIPLLKGRGLVRGAPAAYVCRGFTCRLPVTTPA